MTAEAERAARAHAWRLAALLTGRIDEADEAVEQILADRAALASLEANRLDRLVTLRCREIVGARPLDARTEPALADLRLLDALPQQAREAFALIEVGERSLIDAARAMDCSRTAASRHLERARASLRDRLDERGGGAGLETLRRRLAALNPGPSVERIEWRRRVRRRRRLILIAAAIGLIALGTLALLGLT